MNPRALRILHLFANYKWTGPADVAMRSAVWQERAGHEVVFAIAGHCPPGGEHRMAVELRNAKLAVVTGLELRKHFHARSIMRDARALAQRLRRDRFDVVVSHSLGDHLIASLSLRGLGPRRPALVRCLYDDEAPRRGWRTWLAFDATDGVVAPTAAVAHDVARRFGFTPSDILVQEPPTESFRRHLDGDLRSRWGVPKSAFLVGITARIQPHRRFDLLWATLARVAADVPDVRVVLLGRGNERDTRRLVLDPIANLGLGDRVVLPGYLYEPDYSLALRSLDAFLFLVPGSDGTCRALREATALGLPAVGTPRGLIPHLLGPPAGWPSIGPCGLVAEEDADALAAALRRLATEPELCAALRAAGLARAQGPAEPAAAAARFAAFVGGLRGVAPDGGGR
jgi:glycosyltransferase involved in cell wall biosynthesis